MADIDELRGAPKGHTAKSEIVSDKLRKAAIVTAMSSSTILPANAQTPTPEKNHVDDGHKVEVVVQPENRANQENTIDFATARSIARSILEEQQQNAENKTPDLNPEDITIIYYDDKDPYYIIVGQDGEVTVKESQLDANKISKEAVKEFEKRTKGDVSIKKHKASKQEEAALRSTGHGFAASFSIRDNTIYEYDYKNIDESQIFNKDIVMEHEKTHAKDAQNPEVGIWNDKTVDQKKMISHDLEISANITELAQGLEKYKKSGNLDDIKALNAGDLSEFKEWLAANPDKIGTQECNLRGALAVKQGFLENNNFSDTPYMKQASQIKDMTDFVTDYAATSSTNNANVSEYMKATDAIYSNTALGDVRAVMGHYIDIGAGTTTKDMSVEQQNLSQAELFLLKASTNTEDIQQATVNMATVLHAVRDAQIKGDDEGVERTISEVCARDVQLQEIHHDSNLTHVINQANLDGQVTPEEQQQIDKAIKEHVKDVEQNTDANSINQKSVNYKAAMAATLVMAATPMAVQAQNTDRDPVDDGHKIEVFEQSRNIEEHQSENTLNFLDVVAEMEKESAEKTEAETAKAHTEKSEENVDITENIQKIEYNVEDKYYNIECKDGSQIIIYEEALNQRKIEKEAKQDHKEQYSSPVTVEREVLDNDGVVSHITERGDVLSGAYNPDTNTITMYDYADDVPDKAPEQTKELFAKIGKLLNDENVDASTLEHEKSHAEDFNNPNFAIEVNQTVGQIHRKNYDTEIKATIKEAAMALDKFKQTKNIDDIKTLNAGDLQEFKDWLKENPDKADSKECKLKLAKAVYDGWLEQNNKKESSYYLQATCYALNKEMEITNDGDFTALTSGKISPGAIVENSGNIRDYLKMQKDLYSDTALGDVSSVCGGYVEIGAGAKMRDITDIEQPKTQAEQLLQSITNGSKSTKAASRKLNNVLKIVKKADKDGVRTDKEQAKIDNKIQKACNSSEAQKKKDARTIAMKTGRARPHNSSGVKDNGLTHVQENDNSNISMAMLNMSIART